MMGDRYAGKPSLTNHLGQLSLASLWVAKSSTSFGRGKGGNVTSARWQVTLCDLIWHMSSRSGDGSLACKLLYPSLLSGAVVTDQRVRRRIQISGLNSTYRCLLLDAIIKITCSVTST